MYVALNFNVEKGAKWGQYRPLSDKGIILMNE